MLIRTTCPECYKEHHLSDEVEGQSVRCKECGHFFVVAAEGAPADRFAARREGPSDGDASRLPEVIPARPPADEDHLATPPARYGGLKTWLLLAGGVVLVLMLLCGGAGGVGWYFLYGRGPATVTKANYSAIKGGMSETDVQAILGKPTRTVDIEDPFDDPRGDRGKRATLYRKQIWENGKDSIAVTSVDGKVVNWDATLDGNQLKQSDPSVLAKALDQGAAPAPGPGFPRNPPPPLNTSTKGRVTQANYDAIVVNQTRAVDLISLIGFPTRTTIEPGGPPVRHTNVYVDGPAQITVTVTGGVVTGKDGKGLQ